MRSMRTLAGGLAVLAILPAAAAAQQSSRRPFDNSWFWGVKGGVTNFSTYTMSATAPLAGVEWLITRSRGALYLSADQAFFDKTSAIYDPQAESTVREVAIKDVRRFSAALMAFPRPAATLRPYAGLGVGIQVIQTAMPVGDFVSDAQYQQVTRQIDDQSSRAMPMLIVGAQVQSGRSAFFAQGSASPSQSEFLFNRRGTYYVELGARVNLGSAIER